MAYAFGVVAFVVSLLAGGMCSMGLLSLCFLGSPNPAPGLDRIIKVAVVAIVVIQLAILVGGIWLVLVHRPWLAAAVAAIPIVVLLGLFIYAAPA